MFITLLKFLLGTFAKPSLNELQPGASWIKSDYLKTGSIGVDRVDRISILGPLHIKGIFLRQFTGSLENNNILKFLHW